MPRRRRSQGSRPRASNASVAQAEPPTISVLAGVNGAGKSSLWGALVEKLDSTYVNPDTRTQSILAANPELSLDEANARAWNESTELLKQAISCRTPYAFETTLGGNTIFTLLQAAEKVMPVRVWYVGLASPELHIQRVRRRVETGGHDIPESKIRSRFERSRVNLIELLPGLSELRVFDNSKEADAATGEPSPKLLLEMRHGKMVTAAPLDTAPEWVKPILAAALKLAG